MHRNDFVKQMSNNEHAEIKILYLIWFNSYKINQEYKEEVVLFYNLHP